MDRAGWNYPPGDLRVSDADRDQALHELGLAFKAGRITADEFDQRSGQALTARTGKELTVLLADLPLDEALAARATALQRANRARSMRVAIGASATAVIFFTLVAAAGATVSRGPTLQQRELAREMAARMGLPTPQFPSFDWAGVIGPGSIAVLLVVLIIYLRVRLARANRP
jgi:hypothetical protein